MCTYLNLTCLLEFDHTGRWCPGFENIRMWTGSGRDLLRPIKRREDTIYETIDLGLGAFRAVRVCDGAGEGPTDLHLHANRATRRDLLPCSGDQQRRPD